MSDLRPTEDLLQVAIDSSPDWIFVKDLEHRFLLVNHAFAAAQNLKAADMIGRCDTEFWSADLCFGNAGIGTRGFHDDDREAFSGRLVHNPHDVATLADGSLRIFDTYKGPLRNSDGKVYGVLCYSRDITSLTQALESLKRSEERWKILFEYAPDGYYITDTSGIFVDGNRKAEEMVGCGREALIGRSFLEMKLLSPEHLAKAAKGLERSAMGEPTGPDEYLLHNLAGNHIPIEISTYPIEIESTRLILGIARDITDRKRVEEKLHLLNAELEERVIQRTAELSRTNEELCVEVSERRKAEDSARENERRWQSLVNNIEEQHFLYIHDTEGIFTYISPSIQRILGYSPAEFRTHYTRYLTNNPVNDEAVRHTNLSIGGIRQPPYEVEIYHKDGSIRWLEVCEVPVADSEGNITAVQGIAHDVTDRKKTENTLRKYEHITSASRDHMSFVGRDYVYQAVNDEYLRVHNKKLEEIVGHSVSELLGPEVFERIAKPNLDKCLAGSEIHYETWLDLAGAGRRYLDVAYYPFFEKDGSVSGVVVCSRDITERKETEEERHLLEQQMRHTQKLESLGVMAGGIAHDFNNILMAVLGHAELAMMHLPEDSSIREDIEAIVKAAVRAADLSKQMLAYSGRGRFVIHPLDLGETIREITSMLSVSISKKAQLHFNLAPELPAVNADVNQLHQVIMNLVINASDAIGEATGTITVSTGTMHCDRAFLSQTWLNEDLPAGLYVYLEVTDTGCGMDKETLSKIFDPFFSTKFAGRGLGLAAVLGIIRSHRGALQIWSEPGKGSRFTIFFPALPERAEEMKGEDTSATEQEFTGTVLLVDDEDGVRDVAGKMLESMGLKVLKASNGREALEVFRAHQKVITCVLLDLTMPEMDGEETFHELKKVREGIRVILSSGYTSEDVLQRFMDNGLAGFIEKPYTLDSLRSNIRRVIQGDSPLMA